MVPTPTICKFGERPFRIIAGHEMVISVSATIISKREITVSNHEIIFNGITGEIISDSEEMKFATRTMTSDAEWMKFATGEMTSDTREMRTDTREKKTDAVEMKTDAVEATPTFAAVTTITASQTIIIAKTY